ncbi:hypothetical protein [Streptomyces sp. NPDC006784]|uniref:hypothetical protein n=1 Tax=Streptomyces sp. NPDC006784 TaxID=3364764 RepID=UPI0036746C07
MARKETKTDEAKRTRNLRGELFTYRSDGANRDQEFADVLSQGLTDPYLRETPHSDSQPNK